MLRGGTFRMVGVRDEMSVNPSRTVVARKSYTITRTNNTLLSALLITPEA